MNNYQTESLLQIINKLGLEIGGLRNGIDKITDQLKRIADNFEATDKKAKEEMLDKIKQALEE